MIFREAEIKDFHAMHVVRVAVQENILPDPNMISAKDYEEFLMHRGKGWVCEIEDAIVGFAIVDLRDNNVWALFVHPEFDGKGIGKRLHDEMLEWYFAQTDTPTWLGTSPNTRAEKFYRKAGWKETGQRPNGEIRFELSAGDWIRIMEER